jgi:hypothetical protein
VTFARAYALLDKPLGANAALSIPRPAIAGASPPQWLVESIAQSEGFYSSGMDPASVADPFLRASYEAAFSIERFRSDFHMWNTCLKDAAHDSLLGFACNAEQVWGPKWPDSAELRNVLRSNGGTIDAAERVISAARNEINRP